MEDLLILELKKLKCPKCGGTFLKTTDWHKQARFKVLCLKCKAEYVVKPKIVLEISEV